MAIVSLIPFSINGYLNVIHNCIINFKTITKSIWESKIKCMRVAIVNVARTPFGHYGGSLREIDFYGLGAISIREVLKRFNLKPQIVDEVL